MGINEARHQHGVTELCVGGIRRRGQALGNRAENRDASGRKIHRDGLNAGLIRVHRDNS